MNNYHLIQIDNIHPDSVGYRISFELLNEWLNVFAENVTLILYRTQKGSHFWLPFCVFLVWLIEHGN